MSAVLVECPCGEEYPAEQGVPDGNGGYRCCEECLFNAIEHYGTWVGAS